MSERYPELKAGMLVRTAAASIVHRIVLDAAGELATMHDGAWSITKYGGPVVAWARATVDEYSPDNGTTRLPYRPEPEPVVAPDEVFVNVYKYDKKMGVVAHPSREEAKRALSDEGGVTQRYTKPLNWRKCVAGQHIGGDVIEVYNSGSQLRPMRRSGGFTADLDSRFWIPVAELLATLPKE